MDFDTGVSVLLQKYPAETVQILLSLMRSYEVNGVLFKLAFHTLVGLSKLNVVQKAKLFGSTASYRADRKQGDLSGFQSRVRATTGVRGGFGDDGLDLLTSEELKARVRQTNNYLRLVKEKLSKMAMNESSGSKLSATSFKDPKGYFKELGLDPTTGPEYFDVLLNACYRTLALKKHPSRRQYGRFPETRGSLLNASRSGTTQTVSQAIAGDGTICLLL
jgi:hypothetical protein